MIISVLKETKELEARVALTPANVQALVQRGHQVLVQKGAGVGSGFADADYRKAGGAVLPMTRELIRKSKLILKVKEPTLSETALMNSSQIVFAYLHLAALPVLTKKILKSGITALGYETVRLSDGSLPLLKPMSEIAGKLAAQNGAHFLRADCGGRGVLLGGTERVAPARVVVIGGGTVGQAAAGIAVGMGGETVILDISPERLTHLEKKYDGRVKTFLSTPQAISEIVPKADLVIGAVLIPGAKTPKLVSRDLVKKMRKGSVIVDVSVDQGGCVATSEVTSHARPIVVKYGILHYGVPNIPAVVPVTATKALTEATFPYIQSLADNGLSRTLSLFPEMEGGVNCRGGKIVHPALQMSF